MPSIPAAPRSASASRGASTSRMVRSPTCRARTAAVGVSSSPAAPRTTIFGPSGRWAAVASSRDRTVRSAAVSMTKSKGPCPSTMTGRVRREAASAASFRVSGGWVGSGGVTTAPGAMARPPGDGGGAGCGAAAPVRASPASRIGQIIATVGRCMQSSRDRRGMETGTGRTVNRGGWWGGLRDGYRPPPDDEGCKTRVMVRSAERASRTTHHRTCVLRDGLCPPQDDAR